MRFLNQNHNVRSAGVPIKPMLAKICSGGLADAARQLRGAPFLAEFKYDGQVRIQPPPAFGRMGVLHQRSF